MIYRFGVFEFDDETKELRKNGRAAALEPQPAKALALLLAKGGEIVSREQLRDAVWGADTHVDFDRGLSYCISQIRSALGDSGDNPRFVQTIPKRGFTFIAPLSVGAKSASRTLIVAAAAVGLLVVLAVALVVIKEALVSAGPAVIAVSVFDNETGLAEHDRLVAGLSDLVVARLATIDPERIAVIGNSAVLRQPRNIRNLE